jgi:2-dehydro-3-deoxygalactonokinase
MAVTAGATGPGQRPAAFERELEALCGDWLRQAPGLPLLACGMVGSNQGWAEAAYRPLPADLLALPEAPTEVSTAHGPLLIVPGLLKDGTSGNADGLPDVIRGEETQLLGTLQQEPGDAVVVLPGTHTKWVRLAGSTVTDFATSMTGELYALLVKHSILGRLAREPEQPDEAAFLRGLDVASGGDGSAGILASLFSARTLVMTGRLEPSGVGDYISGLLIGTEVAGFARRWLGGAAGGRDRPLVTICANSALTSRYARALQQAGITADLAPEDAAARGLWRTAVLTGLIAKEAA